MTRRMIRSFPCLAFVLAASMALVAPALAQTGEQKEAADFAITGKVTAVDAVERTITIQGPNDDGGSYDVDAKALIENGDRTIALRDVKAGWGVTANGDLRDGKKVVTYLETDDTP